VNKNDMSKDTYYFCLILVSFFFDRRKLFVELRLNTDN